MPGSGFRSGSRIWIPSRPLVVASTSTAGGVFATESALRLFDFDAMPERVISRSPLAHLETLVGALALARLRGGGADRRFAGL